MARRYHSDHAPNRFRRRPTGAAFALAAILSGGVGIAAAAGAASGRLAGGPGPDIFRIGALHDSPVTIVDFNPAEGDQIDLRAFLKGYGPRSRETDFIRMRAVRRGTIVAVDPSGSGRAFTDAALILGIDLTHRQLATPDPLPEPIREGDLAVELLDLVQVPGHGPTSAFAPLQYLYHAGDRSGRMFVCDLRGQIRVVESGALLPEPFLDVAAVLGEALDTSDATSGGLRTFAFHPDFATAGAAGFGKLYTVTIEVIGAPAAATDGKLFPLRGQVATLDVLSEWSLDESDPNRINPNSRRTILRIEEPKIGHSTEHIGFNPNARPQDADYGQLYIAVGDGGFNPTDPDQRRNGQNPRTVLGTILRIDPLVGAAGSYTVPADNPFVGKPGFLPEVWAYGFRNPQRFSWDTGGGGKMLIGDIGQANVEEVDLGAAGANYGWRAREGTFALGRSETRLFELPPFDISFHYTYPVAQYGHDAGLTAIAGGYVYRGSRVPDLIGKYVFGDVVSGQVYYADVTRLTPGRQATLHRLRLLRNGQQVDLLTLIGEQRVDLRFGQDEGGEIYLLTKQDGMIRTFGPRNAGGP